MVTLPSCREQNHDLRDSHEQKTLREEGLRRGLCFAVRRRSDHRISLGSKKLLGKVLDRQDNPLPNAVVYLTNNRTRAVKTYIVGPDGTYRFPALTTSVDYEVYAQYEGRKSDVKSVSQFDDRSQVYIDLKITTK